VKLKPRKQCLEEDFVRQREEQERFYGTNVPFLHEFALTLGERDHSQSHQQQHSHHTSASCSPVSTPSGEREVPSSHSFH